MSAAAGRSRYLAEVRNCSSDRFDNLGPRWGEREACMRPASRCCSATDEACQQSWRLVGGRMASSSARRWRDGIYLKTWTDQYRSAWTRYLGLGEHKSQVIPTTNLVAEVLNRNIGCSVALRRNEDFKHGEKACDDWIRFDGKLRSGAVVEVPGSGPTPVGS